VNLAYSPVCGFLLNGTTTFAIPTTNEFARSLRLRSPADERRFHTRNILDRADVQAVLRGFIAGNAVDELYQSRDEDFCTPPCSLLPTPLARVVIVLSGTRTRPHRLALTLPHGGCLSKLP
jgi:hypothetical protein